MKGDKAMTKEQKEGIFNVMLQLEKLAEKKTYDGHDYNEQANGSFAILQAPGIGREYIRWSDNK